MEKTENIGYKLPQSNDYVRIEDLNENTKNIDKLIAHLEANVNSKANLHSPRFTGEPTILIPDTIAEYDKIITERILSAALEVEKLS